MGKWHWGHPLKADVKRQKIPPFPRTGNSFLSCHPLRRDTADPVRFHTGSFRRSSRRCTSLSHPSGSRFAGLFSHARIPHPAIQGTRKTSVPYHVHKGCTDLRFFRQKPESQPHSIHGTGEMTGSMLSSSLLSKWVATGPNQPWVDKPTPIPVPCRSPFIRRSSSSRNPPDP